ncbi:hypothetical protein NPD5_271 [Clostridium sporogenes]|uniref:Uncharacterized protein n=1 Tax=Clostridium sporogenes TaxID=1509 RepID=A0A1J1CTM7_CLOSG|nr:hypothetical protein [Clostridium sporogenes]APF25854.1 hypothetical protein NPD7_1258 [Clostridium sporogenes]APH17309.1 hypothetical protein NPD5_271 [Clostridium sporogenes]
MRRILIALMIIFEVSIILCGCTKYELAGEVESTVTSKEYRKSSITMIPMTISNAETITTTMRPQINPEQYNIKLKYKNITTTINNKEVYESVETGDRLKVNYYITSNKKKEKIEWGGK